MAIKKTLAQNHLSDLARQGRGGDTELAHVNPQEKAMLKAMGGSGTINPNTGLREYAGPMGLIAPMTSGASAGSTAAGGGFLSSLSSGVGSALGAIGGAMPLVGLGLSLIGGYTSSKAAREQAEEQSELSADQAQAVSDAIDEAQKALGALGPSRGAKVQVAKEEYAQGVEGLGIQKEEGEHQLSTAIQKSDLVTSAGITRKKSSMWKQFQYAEKGLMGQLGKAMGGIEEWFEGEKSRLEGVMKQATFQKKAAERAANKKFLGIF